MLKLQKLEIIKQESVAPGHQRLTLAKGINALAGQFVHVRVSETYDPFLRRPISVHDCTEGRLVLLYRTVGRGTELLAAKKAGETLDLLGPLGNSFPLTDRPQAVVVAGGIGAAPLYYLLRSLKQAGKQVSFFYGARNEAELILRDEYRALVANYSEATDDGSAGTRALVTHLAAPVIAGLDATVYACGPSPMLKEVARLADCYGRSCFVSLEAQLACGVGACLGCVVPVKGREKYRRVCVDGPVFAAGEVFFC
ncbi:MAG: Dihydroorotate dehydrogenase B (NAD(+)), electron transfer subunit [Dehalococcoidia bacterium]|nr:Dihydroorotate dehydrogenase B (NAD(+)), electron transfer subunit [Bacillota bacterium]